MSSPVSFLKEWASLSPPREHGQHQLAFVTGPATRCSVVSRRRAPRPVGGTCSTRMANRSLASQPPRAAMAHRATVSTSHRRPVSSCPVQRGLAASPSATGGGRQFGLWAPAGALVDRVTPGQAAGANGAVQDAHRRTCCEILDRHSGQSWVASTGSGSVRNRAISLLTGSTTTKYTAAATSRNEMTALRKSPYRSVRPVARAPDVGDGVRPGRRRCPRRRTSAPMGPPRATPGRPGTRAS